MRGALLENLVVSEAVKHRYNRVRRPSLSFYRDSSGRECDLIHRRAGRLAAFEIKSGATVASDWFTTLGRISEDLPAVTTKAVVYGGTERQQRTAADVVPWAGFADYLGQIDAAPYPPPAPGHGEGPTPPEPPPGDPAL